MAEGRERTAWNRTAALLATMANLVRGKGRRAHRVEEFHPMLGKRELPELVSPEDFCRAAKTCFPVRKVKLRDLKRGE